MPGLVDIGKRTGQALGARLFTAGGQLITSSASGVASILSTGTSGQYLTTDGSTLSWGSLPVYQRVAVVASDVTHTQSNTTLSDVTGLAIPVTTSATEVWFFEAYLKVSATTTAVDTKWGFTVPTSATMSWGTLSAASALTGFVGVATGTTAIALTDQTGTLSLGTLNGTTGIALAGWANGAGNAGNVQLQFAQNTSDASNLTIKAGSFMRYTRLVA